VTGSETHRAIRAVWTFEAGKLIARLTRIVRDVGLAEELAQDALVAALESWPQTGVPDNPGAWLMTTAKHRALNVLERTKMLERKHAQLGHEQPTSHGIASELDAALDDDVGDDLLRLLFIACHPVLSSEARAALTLRMLGGLTTEEIARAFLSAPATMAQRLVRAKTKIRDAKIPYEVPEASQLAERTDAVMTVIYLVFNEGYAATSGDDLVRRDLAREAIRLGRLLVELTAELPGPNAEARGLLALMLLHDSRRDTRTDAAGDLVLLEDQDRARWDRAQIAEALELVPAALRGGPGRYALQAAIAALHASAPRATDTDWPQIAGLFAELLRRHPTPVVALNHGVAIAMAHGPAPGLVLIDELQAELSGYHLWHAARADLLRRLGRTVEAAAAYREALVHVGSAPERRFLERRLAELAS